MSSPLPRCPLVAVLVACTTGCHRDMDRRAPQGTTAAAPFVVDSIRLDSCEVLDSENSLPVDSADIPPLHPGSWTTVMRVRRDSFSLEVPTVVEERAHDGAWWLTGFPTCGRNCGLTLRLDRDTLSRSVDDYVARLRSVDTAAHPDRWIPGLPRGVSVHGERGLLMSAPCGDCVEEDLALFGNGQIVSIEASVDNQVGYRPGLLCRLARVATTFRWETPGRQ